MSTFNDRTGNTHRVEFEAPNSAEVQPLKERKHFSIDLTLELEHQLNMDSPPVTPTHYPVTATDNMQLMHEALDPEVLAHLVSQLRHSLSEMTKERDGLAKLLAASHTRQADQNDALQHMTDKVTDLGEELDAAKKKMKEDEEAISLLRTKVEESRRGLMRLQTENRRQSMTPIDVNRASLALLASPPSAKRASFAPLAGRANSHRRVSSVSSVLGLTGLDTSPNSQVLALPDVSTVSSASSSAPPSSGARYPTLFGRHSPQPDNDAASLSEMKELQDNLQRVKRELDTARHELLEATEAKQASETCVEALRQFIAENNVGSGESSAPSAIKLPPPPTMTTGEEEDTKKTSVGWGFKLWGGEPLSSVPQSPSISSPRFSAAGAAPPAPMARKLGNFFSSRSASISSLPPLQSNASIMRRNPSQRSGSSDVSSVTEPISPSSDIHGLGTAPIMIHDSSNFSDAGSAHAMLEIKNLDLELVR